MSLTSAEEAEYRRLQKEEEVYQTSLKGDAAVEAVDGQRMRAPPPTERSFSFVRSTVGGLRDAVQGTLDTAADLSVALDNLNPLPDIHFGRDASNGYVSVGYDHSGAAFLDSHRLVIADFKGSENAGTAEKLTRGLISFAVPFVVWSKVTGVVRGASWLGRAGRAMVAGAATDFTTTNPASINLANTLKETFGLTNPILDALATEHDDSALYARFKAAAVNAPVGLLADGIFEAGFKGVQAYRAWRGSAEEASATVKALTEDASLKASARDLPDAPEAAAEGAPAATKAKKRAKVQDTVTGPEKAPESIEDVVDFLKRKSGIDADADVLKMAQGALDSGHLETLLSRLGLDPAKIDFARYDDPAALGALLKSLGDTLGGISGALGRTGIRVTEEATARTARTLATSADVIKDLYGGTANLAENMMAGQLFTRAHAHKLVSLAQEALKAIKAGDGAMAWSTFTDSFARQAYFQGAVTGASSEIGRALRLAGQSKRVGLAAVKAAFKDAAEKGAAHQVGAVLSPDEVKQGISLIDSEAEQIMLLSRLIDKGGDVGDLSRFVRVKAGSALRRIDGATRETVGNLFTPGTGLLNAAATVAMLGTRGLAKTMVAVGRLALSPLGAKHAQAARVAAAEAWAYADGPIAGWRDAVSHTWALMQKEGLEEAALNFDNLGAKKLAAKAAGKSAEGATHIGENFERVDIEKSERKFAMTPADRRYLNGIIEEWGTKETMEHSLKFLVRAAGAAVNAAGSLTRLGTIAFINVPDQFIGTMAARAGAQAHAVRLAAQEAAELALDGPALSKFLKARVVQLTSTVEGHALESSYDAGQREVALAHGAAEAREVLFQDRPEFAASNAMVHAFGATPFAHFVVPFVRTPLRILERTAIDYTPLGLLKDRTRRAIMAGGPARDEAIARIGLGTLLVVSAFQMAEDRRIVGQDGGFKSTARLSRPSYSLKIGDDQIEVQRVDPLGTLLGWGADVRAYLDANEGDPEASKGATEMIEAALWATQANILSKSWLASIKNLTDLAGAGSPDDFSTRFRTYVNTFAPRFVPGSGIQRAAVKGGGEVYEASTFMESLIKASIGADTLPVKRDQLLGRPVALDTMDRLVGIKAGPGASDTDSPLLAELERLSFNTPASARTQAGVKLNATQFSRWLELKGQVVKNEGTGLTLEQTLTALIKLPEYKALNRPARVMAMRNEMAGFAHLATVQLLREDHDFAYRALKRETWAAMVLQGAPPAQIDAETQRMAQQLGLGPKQ